MLSIECEDAGTIIKNTDYIVYLLELLLGAPACHFLQPIVLPPFTDGGWGRNRTGNSNLVYQVIVTPDRHPWRSKLGALESNWDHFRKWENKRISTSVLVSPNEGN
jgi:hypothetical protein